MPDRTRKWNVRVRGKGQVDDLGTVQAIVPVPVEIGEAGAIG